MKNSIIILLIIFCSGLQAQTVKIAAASNLRDILNEIKTKYSVVNPKANIVVSLGSSGALVQQITNGADFDLFMAADKIYPEKLKAQGIVNGEVITYAIGRLVIWSNTVDLSKGLDIITDNSVKRIAITKPDLAPYGARAIECLNFYNLFDKVKNKIVYADNIAQAAQFTQTGNAEIGFIALALAMGQDMHGTYIMLDTLSYKPIEQALVLTKSLQTNPEAAKFMNFVLSDECNPVFEKFGFIVPKHE